MVPNDFAHAHWQRGRVRWEIRAEPRSVQGSWDLHSLFLRSEGLLGMSCMCLPLVGTGWIFYQEDGVGYCYLACCHLVVGRG